MTLFRPLHYMAGVEHALWLNIMKRCYNPKARNYKFYGARGIKVCERWHAFENFHCDMGPRPHPEFSVDRLDVHGNYSPENCKWCCPFWQSNNRSNMHFDADERVMLSKHFMDLYEAMTPEKKELVDQRLKANWRFETAMTWQL